MTTAGRYTAFSFTHVMYERGSPVSFLLGLSGLLPLAILCCLVFWIAMKRELQSLVLLIGLLLNELLNSMLKNMIREERPQALWEAGHPQGNIFTQYGMPSSHAQFMFFFLAAYPIMLRMRKTNPERLLIALVVTAASVLCTFSRYHFQYHSLGQVTAGAAVGSLSGIAWRWLAHRWWLTRMLDLLAETSLARRIKARSMAHIEDRIEFEYEAVINHNRAVHERIKAEKSR